MLTVLQGMAEYGGLSGQAGGGVRGFQGWPVSQWVTAHRTELLIAAAVLLLLWVLRALFRRAY